MGKIPSSSSHTNEKLSPSTAESVGQNCSVTSLPKDQMIALVNNIANAQKNLHQEESIVQKNLQDIKQRFSSLPKGIRFMLEEKELHITVLTPERNSKLPILEKGLKDLMDLSSPLPNTLQKERSFTVLDLLKQEFPKLTSSSFFNKETK